LFDQDLPYIECYPGELNQVFLNILINAVHAIRDTIGDTSQEKGKIKITTSHTEDWVEVRIADSGTGIPKEIQSRIFDPFFTTKEVGRGTGQGLAISHNIIVQKHGGTIRFETEKGRGTTFIIQLPTHGHGQEESMEPPIA
jgi:signal transduction histidine kinase